MPCGISLSLPKLKVTINQYICALYIKTNIDWKCMLHCKCQLTVVGNFICVPALVFFEKGQINDFEMLFFLNVSF